MTRKELNVFLAAVLTTANDIQPCPESSIYLALGCDIDEWQTVKGLLLSAELATFRGYSVTLTDKGRVLAEKCNALVASKVSA